MKDLFVLSMLLTLVEADHRITCDTVLDACSQPGLLRSLVPHTDDPYSTLLPVACKRMTLYNLQPCILSPSTRFFFLIHLVSDSYISIQATSRSELL